MQKQRSNSKQNNNHSHKKPKNHKKNHMDLQLSKQLQVGSKHKNQLLKPSISPQNKKSISKNRTNNFDNQVNKQQYTLKVALELAQFHKNQFQKQKAKSQQLERKIQQINQQLCGLAEQNAKLIQKQKKHQDKYKKLKQKYKQLKKSPFCQNKQIQNTPEFQSHPQSLNHSRINNQPFLLSYTTEKLQRLTKQIFMKNSTIIQLSEKIQECEHTTQNIYHLMDALQQKIQQLVKQNTILRKISNMVSKQKSRKKNGLAVIQHLCDSSQQIKISCSKVLKNNIQQENTNQMNGIKNSNFSKLQTDYQINNKQNENNINLDFKKSVNGSHKLDNLSNSYIEYKDNIRENVSQSIIKNHQQAIKHDHIYRTKNRMSGILTSTNDNANHHTKYMQMDQHQNQQQLY